MIPQSAVHNRQLLIRQLRSSVEAMEDEYELVAADYDRGEPGAAEAMHTISALIDETERCIRELVG